MEPTHNTQEADKFVFSDDMVCAFLIVFALFMLNGAAILWLQNSHMISGTSASTLSIQEREALLEEVMRSSLAEVEQIPIEEKIKILEALEADAAKGDLEVEKSASTGPIQEP